MSVITFYNYYNRPQKMIPLLNVLNQIKTGKYRRLIEKFRNCYEDDPGGELDSMARIVPRFSVSGNFIINKEKEKIVSYSGNFLLEIPYLNRRDLASVKSQLKDDPYVLACFVNALNCGLVIIVRSNGKRDQHRLYYKLALNYYQNLTGVKGFSKKGIRVNHSCMVSLDEDTFIGLGAIPFSDYLES